MNKWHEWFQFILFLAGYALLDYAYFQIPDSTLANFIYYYGFTAVCTDVINIIAPLEQVSAQQNHLLSANTDLEIVRGCDGAGILFLLVSAILAFPSKWPRKLLGVLIGIGLIYFLNLLRISILYFFNAYHPEWFQMIHVYLAPTLMVMAGCAYFAWWAFGSTHKLHEPT